MALSKFLDPKNDIAFKKIFGSEKNKDILIHFINDIMKFKDDHQVQNVTFLSPVQDPEIAYKKQSLVDVLCEAQNGTKIIVEMQVSPSKGFEKRAQYYAAKAYSRQLNHGQGEDGLYANLKKVIFIAISNYTIFVDKEEYISHHVILDKQTYEHDLRDFSFSFIELPKFQVDKIEDLKNIIEKWCYFFKYAAKTSEADLKRIIGSDTVIERAYEALNQFNWNETDLIAYEQEIKRIMDNRAVEDYKKEQAEKIMKIAIAEGEARGIEEGKKEGKKEGIEIGQARGIEKGRKEGIEIGQVKGIEEGIKQTAINMLKAKLDDNLIKSVTGFSQETLDKIKNEL